MEEGRWGYYDTYKSVSRQSQWYNAIEKLSLGGGGIDITLDSLLNEVKEEYPNFKV